MWVAYPPPGDLPDPGIDLASLRSAALAGGLFTASAAVHVNSLQIQGQAVCHLEGRDAVPPPMLPLIPSLITSN